MTIRIGTRGSELALWQARWVASELERFDYETEIAIIETSGDRHCLEPIASAGLQGVFTREIQKSLLSGEIDLAVHSLKDMPTESVPGLDVAAVPIRGDWRDAFVCPKYGSIFELPENARIGTGSLRRKCQLSSLMPGRFKVRDVRGNVLTRLAKLDAGEFDAIILAAAGLIRLGAHDRIRSYLDYPEFLPAPGQGALALEIRDDDESTRRAVTHIDHRQTHAAVVAERTFLKELQGGCIAPIAALAKWQDETMTLYGRIISPDCSHSLEDFLCWSVPGESSPFQLNTAARELGTRLANILLDRGAGKIVEQINLVRSEAATRPHSSP